MQVDKDNVFLRSLVWLNLISFVPIRFGTTIVLMYILSTIYIQAPVMSSMLGLSTIVMIVIYVILFMRLCKTDIIRFYSQHSQTKIDKDSKDTNANEVIHS